MGTVEHYHSTRVGSNKLNLQPFNESTATGLFLEYFHYRGSPQIEITSEIDVGI